MSITTQTIIDRYNLLYSGLNNNVHRQYSTLTKGEIELTLSVINAESTNTSGSSGGSIVSGGGSIIDDSNQYGSVVVPSGFPDNSVITTLDTSNSYGIYLSLSGTINSTLILQGRIAQNGTNFFPVSIIDITVNTPVSGISETNKIYYIPVTFSSLEIFTPYFFNGNFTLDYIISKKPLMGVSALGNEQTGINYSIHELYSIVNNLQSLISTSNDSLIPGYKYSIFQYLIGLRKSFGNFDDLSAQSDELGEGLIALFKRLLTIKLPNIVNGRIPVAIEPAIAPNVIDICGTVSTIGDNTIIATPGTGLSIYITRLSIQNESSVSTTIILKDSSNKLRILAPVLGSGIIGSYSTGREIKLIANTPLILNLSGVNSIGYSFGYYIAP